MQKRKEGFLLKPQRLKTNALVVMAFLMTTEIIFTRFLSFQTPIVRIGTGFLPMSMMAILYGPFWTGFAYAACDLIGMVLFPRGAFLPGFTLTAFLTGVIYGLVLHNKPIRWGRTFVAALIVGLFCNLFLDTIWLHIYFGHAIIVLLPMRLLRVGITIPLQTVLIYVVNKRCAPLLAKFSSNPEVFRAQNSDSNLEVHMTPLSDSSPEVHKTQLSDSNLKVHKAEK